MTHPDTLTLPRAVVEQALNAMIGVVYGDPVFGDQAKSAITSLRAALQPQVAAEPVAWLYFHNRAEPELSVDLEEPECTKSFDTDVVWKKPLYTTPPATQAALTAALEFLNRVTHWQEGRPDLHDMKVMLKEVLK